MHLTELVLPILWVTCFITPLYFTRVSRVGDPYVPKVARHRIVLAGLGVVISLTIQAILQHYTGDNIVYSLHLAFNPRAIIVTAAVILIAYLPSIITTLTAGQHFSLSISAIPTAPGLRVVLFAPVFEEIVYRAQCIGPYIIAGETPWGAIVYASAVFAVSHAHHVVNLRLRGFPWSHCVSVAAFTAAYTGLFGLFTTMVLVKTQSTLACIVAHSLCNYLGLPDLSVFRGWWVLGQLVAVAVSTYLCVHVM
ncbi:CAAX amino terminal protease [Carpediemonas membranifera]|uniref:intramembrane prenyl-peptidase Rce1 n=1 Tax=Carpediemonas membranifera TaxID=201153 RepID=A0A8J6B721_9EUKA|nr:CAAX amino terminal protease [Carpediemonas membranifera]|eukprot:KAG9395629.1 CAAX amino terminal protease [Carpediemonas membranifera]